MFKILDEMCMPTKGSEFSACVDLYARKDVVIGAGETVLVPLGVKIDLEKLTDGIDNIYPYNEGMLPRYKLDHFMKTHQLNLHIRSSMSAKHGLIIANGTGIIDMDYENEIMLCVHKPLRFRDIFAIPYDFILDSILGKKRNLKSYSKFFAKKGDKIAQIGLVEHKTYLLGVESKEKRNGGFGSTGE